MSLGYDVFVKVKKDYNRQNIKDILDKGKQIGFVYYKYISIPLEIYSLPLSIDDAVNNVMEENEDGLQCLTVQINSTYSTLHIMDYGYLSLMLANFYYPWLKKFEEENDQDVDIGRYAKVMLDLVSDFKIIEMKIEKD